MGMQAVRQVFPQLFHVLPNFLECFYNLVETLRSTCVVISFGKHCDEKMKNNFFTLIIKM